MVDDRHFPLGTRSPFARCVSAEIRAAMAARRLTIRELAATAGYTTHNYLAIRLRDERPFTLDDVDRIAFAFELSPDELLDAARRHMERVLKDMDGQWHEIWSEEELDQYREPSDPAETMRNAASTESQIEPGDLEHQ